MEQRKDSRATTEGLKQARPGQRWLPPQIRELPDPVELVFRRVRG